MELKFEVSGRINKPVDEVFEAVVNPDQLSAYFTTGGAKGRLETGATVYWDFHDFSGAFPVEVVEVEKHRRIILQWAADVGLGSSYGNCGGWMQMLCAMKAWLEHGVNLREGMFK